MYVFSPLPIYIVEDQPELRGQSLSQKTPETKFTWSLLYQINIFRRPNWLQYGGSASSNPLVFQMVCPVCEHTICEQGFISTTSAVSQTSILGVGTSAH